MQFTDLHFPDLNPNSYDNLNNMKLDLNVSTRSVSFSTNNQDILSFSLYTRQSDCKFLPGVFLCIFQRALTWAFAEMEYFARGLNYLSC